MYRHVLGIEFPDSPPIFRAIKVRHDLVHRNGKTKNGEPIPIDKGHVLALTREVDQFLRQIDTDLDFRDAPF